MDFLKIIPFPVITEFLDAKKSLNICVLNWNEHKCKKKKIMLKFVRTC